MNDVATPPPEIVRPQRVGFAFAKRHGVLVHRVHEGIAECVYRPGAAPLAVAEVRRYLGIPIRLEKVEVEQFDSLLRVAYEAGNDAMQAAEGVEESTDLAHLAQDLPEQADLLESEDDAPIIRLINAVLTQAVKENASDIHVEPFENRLVVRFRVDGVLREVLQSRRAVAPLVVSRIKVMSKLDIAEKRLPQDGRISLKIAGRSVDVRVSTLPSGHGERVVMRILDKQAGRLHLSALGMDPKTEQRIAELFRKPHGIILVTGPTGSGKTTTLYAGLEHLNDNTQNIMTVEDPIEYYIDGIGQTQVNTKVEMTFARGLARHPAPGPGRGDGRRNPRPRNRADRGAGLAHRPPGVVDAAHQHRRRRAHAPARHGYRALPAVVQPHRRRRAAPGAHAQPREQGAVRSRRIRTPPARALDPMTPRPRCIDPVPGPAASAAAPASTSWSSSTTRCAR